MSGLMGFLNVRCTDMDTDTAKPTRGKDIQIGDVAILVLSTLRQAPNTRKHKSFEIRDFNTTKRSD